MSESAPKAIVVGATSGIGEALARALAQAGYTVGIAGRREELLAAIQRELPEPNYTRRIDVADPEAAMREMDALIAAMGGVDLVVLASGIARHNPELQWELEKETIAVNVSGFVALATHALRYFLQRGSGHLVGISSVAGLRASRGSPSYSASKAFMINYLEGLNARAHQSGLPVYVTDIRPGFVDTPMTRGQRGMFWVSTPEKAARQIVAAIRKKKRYAYITRRWVHVARLLRHLPAWVHERY